MPVAALAFCQNDRFLAQGDLGRIALWDLAEAKVSRFLKSQTMEGRVKCLAFLEKKKLFACGEGLEGKSGVVHLLSVEDSEEISCFRDPKDVVMAIAADPSEKLLACGATDGFLYLYDIESKGLRKKLKAHRDWITAIQFLSGGNTFATASCDRTVRFWKTGDFSSAGSITFSEALWGLGIGSKGQLVAASAYGPTRPVSYTHLTLPTKA